MLKYNYTLITFVIIMTINRVSGFNNIYKSPQHASAGVTGQAAETARKVLSVKQKTALFEQAPPSPVSPKPISPKRPVSPQDPLLAFQDKLKTLDLNHPRLKEQVSQLQSDLNKLKTTNKISEADARMISGALDSLHQPGLYRATFFETTLLNQLGKQFPKLADAMKKFPDAEKNVEREARSQVLKLIKAGSNDLPKLASSLKEKFRAQQSELPKARLQKLDFPMLDTAHPAANFVENFPALLKGFEKLTLDVVQPAFETGAQTFLGQFTHADKLTAVIEKHEFLNLEKALPELVSAAQAKYLSGLTSNVLTQENAVFQSKVQKAHEKWASGIDAYVQGIYDREAPKYAWLDQNTSYIRTIYDQGADADRNLGVGTCFQNSLDREKLITNNPSIPTTAIALGSSQQGRFADASLNAGKVRDNTSQGKRVGLPNAFHVPVTGSFTQQLAKTYLDRKQSMHCVVFISSSEDTCHAVNIQVDEKRKIFRFFDDNLGAFEYPNFETFSAAFSTYLDAWYPDLTTRSLAFFTEASQP